MDIVSMRDKSSQMSADEVIAFFKDPSVLLGAKANYLTFDIFDTIYYWALSGKYSPDEYGRICVEVLSLYNIDWFSAVTSTSLPDTICLNTFTVLVQCMVGLSGTNGLLAIFFKVFLSKLSEKNLDIVMGVIHPMMLERIPWMSDDQYQKLMHSIYTTHSIKRYVIQYGPLIPKKVKNDVFNNYGDVCVAMSHYMMGFTYDLCDFQNPGPTFRHGYMLKKMPNIFYISRLTNTVLEIMHVDPSLIRLADPLQNRDWIKCFESVLGSPNAAQKDASEAIIKSFEAHSDLVLSDEHSCNLYEIATKNSYTPLIIRNKLGSYLRKRVAEIILTSQSGPLILLDNYLIKFILNFL